MFLGLDLLDWILVAALALFALLGWRKSFLMALGGVLGWVAGIIATFFAIPAVSRWVQDPTWRVVAMLAAFVVLLSLGHWLGEGFAALIRKWMDMPRPRWWGRLAGAAVHLAAGLLGVSVIAFTVSALGLPAVSTALAHSKVVTSARDMTPPGVDRALGEARTLVAGMPLPEILAPAPPHDDVPVPTQQPDKAPVTQNARTSVLRISGTATACGVNQTGTSFVVGPDRVITNAHVVQGISQPVVETSDGRALTGKVVAFDPARDVAVVAVSGLNVPALKLGSDLRVGDDAVFMGFPAGGPFQADPAAVQALGTYEIPNIYGADPRPLRIYQLAADVQQGDSGGPVLDQSGRVVGMVFARAKDQDKRGYALSLDVMGSYAKRSTQFTEPVSTGACSAH